MNSHFESHGHTRECECCDGTARLDVKRLDYIYGSGDAETVLRVDTPVWLCDACDTILTADGAEEAQHAAICRHLDRLTPDEIVALRQATGLTQGALALEVGVGRVTVARWETSRQIQTASHDFRMRLLFESIKELPIIPDLPIFKTDVSARKNAAEAFSLAA